jgi:hypothetical protein
MIKYFLMLVGQHFEAIPINPNKIARLYKIIKVKKYMLVELCNNHVIFYGLVNGGNGLFKTTTSLNNISYVWMNFLNSKLGITTRFSNSHLY